jgi:hypothetical protein
MADVTLTVYDVARTGIDLTTAAAVIVVANTYYFPNDGRCLVFLNNATGSTVIPTFVTPGTVDGLAIADKAGSQLTARAYFYGPFPPSIYNDATGRVQMTFNQTADVIVVRV